jgi:Major Facilitator Superfamily
VASKSGFVRNLLSAKKTDILYILPPRSPSSQYRYCPFHHLVWGFDRKLTIFFHLGPFLLTSVLNRCICLDTITKMAEKQDDEKSHIDDRDRDEAALHQQPTHAIYIEKDRTITLSPDHHDYLVKRHGTANLDPIPGYGDADPYNWASWKKVSNLILVAFHALMSTFTAASIIPAYENIAAEFHTTIPRASYLTSLQIAILGGAPLFWRPLSNRYGRRPVFLLSLICSLAGNIGCAKSPDYASMAACRAITAFFISPAAAIGSAVVTETFFKKDRAKWMGVWTVMITLGVPLSPFLFGFVAFRVGYRWIYWILAIVS